MPTKKEAEAPSTAVAVVDHADTALDEAPELPAMAAPVYSDDPDLATDDIQWPRLSLLQPMSDAIQDPESNLKAGTFAVTGETEGRRKIHVVPLTMAITRRYATGPREAEVLHCQSNDGKTGYGDPGGSCRVCPMAQWIPDPERPTKRLLRCQPTYRYLAYCVETDELVEMPLSRTSTGAAKDINNRILTKKLGNFVVELTSEKGKGDTNYYVAVARFPKPDPEVLENARLSLP